MNITALMAEIERVTPEGGEWCSVEKAQTLAALVIALRPRHVVELGTWMGGSAVPIALALRAVNAGELTCIDPWSSAASAEGQEGLHLAWWSTVNHDDAHAAFLARLGCHELTSIVNVRRSRSDDVDPIAAELVYIDGNHGQQAVRDVERFAARIPVGGVLMLDDVDWPGGGVTRALETAREMGFRDIFTVDHAAALMRR